MASRKEKHIKIEPILIYYLYQNWTLNAKLLKQNFSVKETRFWLPPWLDGQKILVISLQELGKL